LPGIIGERFFAVLDLNNDDFIDLKEFVHGLFKVFYSSLETKIKLAFDIFDFDKDDYIKKEDISLVLSYVPIEKQVLLLLTNSLKNFQQMLAKESSHKKEVESKLQITFSEVFLDRIQS
jgi:Ca2+-binding EF-hand superfamily protein